MEPTEGISTSPSWKQIKVQTWVQTLITFNKCRRKGRGGQGCTGPARQPGDNLSALDTRPGEPPGWGSFRKRPVSRDQLFEVSKVRSGPHPSLKRSEARGLLWVSEGMCTYLKPDPRAPQKLGLGGARSDLGNLDSC